MDIPKTQLSSDTSVLKLKQSALEIKWKINSCRWNRMRFARSNESEKQESASAKQNFCLKSRCKTFAQNTDYENRNSLSPKFKSQSQMMPIPGRFSFLGDSRNWGFKELGIAFFHSSGIGESRTYSWASSGNFWGIKSP